MFNGINSMLFGCGPAPEAVAMDRRMSVRPVCNRQVSLLSDRQLQTGGTLPVGRDSVEPILPRQAVRARRASSRLRAGTAFASLRSKVGSTESLPTCIGVHGVTRPTLRFVLLFLISLAMAARGQEAVRMSMASAEAAEARRKAASMPGFYNLKLGPTAW